jgi:hypothetical protein
MYNMHSRECEDDRRKSFIPDELRHLEEGIYMTGQGEKLRG